MNRENIQQKGLRNEPLPLDHLIRHLGWGKVCVKPMDFMDYVFCEHSQWYRRVTCKRPKNNHNNQQGVRQ